MSIEQLRRLPAHDAVGMSPPLVTGASAVSTPPAGAGVLATAAATVMPQLVANAAAASEALAAAVATRDAAVTLRETEVQRAQLFEKDLDQRVRTLERRIQSCVDDGLAGGTLLMASLFPHGSEWLTRLSGRPQRGAYVAWAKNFPKRQGKGSEADREIAPKLREIVRLVQEFGQVLDAKDAASRDADAAILELGAAKERWAKAIDELHEGATVVQRGVPAVVEAWWAPVLDWQNAQEARAARGETSTEEDDLDDLEMLESLDDLPPPVAQPAPPPAAPTERR